MSKYSVHINDPAAPDGADIEVPGLGVFKNKSTRHISEEDAEYFRDVNAQLVDVETDDRPANTGAAAVELQRGPTVLQAFKDHPTITVEAVEQSKPARAQKTEDSSKQTDKEP